MWFRFEGELLRQEDRWKFHIITAISKQLILSTIDFKIYKTYKIYEP